MKTRSEFVSNSSSSSFTVCRSRLTPRDIEILLAYPKWAEQNQRDYWDICDDETRGLIVGTTNMDNCDLSDYLKENNVTETLFVFA